MNALAALALLLRFTTDLVIPHAIKTPSSLFAGAGWGDLNGYLCHPACIYLFPMIVIGILQSEKSWPGTGLGHLF